MPLTSITRQGSKVIPALAMILVVLFAGALSLSQGGHPASFTLMVHEQGNEEALYTFPVREGDRVALHYTHSADKTPVMSIFRVGEEGLVLIEERYSWYGAGLEAGGDYHFSFDEEEVRVSGQDRLFPVFPVRVARSFPQDLLIDNERLRLQDLAPGGTLLLISLQERQR